MNGPALAENDHRGIKDLLAEVKSDLFQVRVYKQDGDVWEYLRTLDEQAYTSREVLDFYLEDMRRRLWEALGDAGT